MKASAVINRYKEGMRDFSGQKLRGGNFAGQNLSGANFSHCDIRGTNFKRANLTKANFTGATAGLKCYWIVIIILFSLILSSLAGFISAIISTFTYYLFTGNPPNRFFICIGSTIFIICFRAMLESEFGENGVITNVVIAIIFIVAVVFFGVTAAVVDEPEAKTGGVYLNTFAVIISLMAVITNDIKLTQIFPIFESLSNSDIFVVREVLNIPIVGTLGGILGAILGSWFSQQAINCDPKFHWLWIMYCKFTTLGGTTFYKANLTQTNFTQALLKCTDFRKATLIQTCFKEAKELDSARVSQTILSYPKVRDLLVTGYGYNKNYKNANLQGANLDGANLNKANFKQCNLNQATLKDAELKEANLTAVSALKTDFTRCYLTGACLEAWNIDQTTILNKVDCQYVFLLEKPNQNGNRERHPHDPDKVFHPGDFEQLYSKIMNTVQLLLRNGVNSEAFKIAFQNIMSENPEITYESIQGIEKKGKDLVVTIEVPEDADRGNIEHQFNKVYEARLEVAKQTELLEAEKEHSKNLTEIVKLLASSKPTTIINETNAMTYSSDSSQHINTRDINANRSIVNLRDISGQVSNNIEKLLDNSEEGKTSLKELLKQLQTAIETEENLKDVQKAEALEAVESLSQAANNPEDSNFKKLAKLSKNALMGIASNLPHAAKFVQECNELLPAIAQFLGLN